MKLAMRLFVSRRIPPFHRVLLVESGSRRITEKFLGTYYNSHPDMRLDLLTCYPGEPEQFRPEQGVVHRVSDYRTADERKRLFQELASAGYTVTGVICSGEPIMTRWKWATVARVPAKTFVINENCDYFWLDRGHLRPLRQFIACRAGLSGTGAVRTIARAVSFPFSLLYLLLFAATVHLRRKLRTL